MEVNVTANGGLQLVQVIYLDSFDSINQVFLFQFTIPAIGSNSITVQETRASSFLDSQSSSILNITVVIPGIN